MLKILWYRRKKSFVRENVLFRRRIVFQNLESPFMCNWIIFSFEISIKSKEERESEKVTALWIVNRNSTCFLNFGPFELRHGPLLLTCFSPFFTLTRELLLIWNFKRIFHTCNGLKNYYCAFFSTFHWT